MAGWALGLLIAYLALAFGVRVGVALRTTGATGIASPLAAPPMEALGGALFIAALLLGSLTPPLVLAGALEAIDPLDRRGVHAVGFMFAGTGIAGTFAAQMAMGSSWRIGVDQSERTDLVTGGVFSLCRNPIYSFMVIAWIGLALLVPTWLSIASTPWGGWRSRFRCAWWRSRS
ncbi:MAG TPA: methyltransferase [Solirubrobacterales bacterium]|nr:methyltransferase [Solirubrobacterales bacterium]